MQLGYMRVSKADGSQVLDLQCDALLAAGVTRERLYEDLASGRHDARPGLDACLKALREGDTLVVESANFNGKMAYQGASENMRLTERFTRVDENTVMYRFTVDDPSTWTRPWSAELPMKKTIGPLFEHACHEGNYGLYNTLAGARAEDKRAMEKAATKGSE